MYNPRLQFPLHRLDEVVAVIAQVEAEQIVAQQSLQNFLAPHQRKPAQIVPIQMQQVKNEIGDVRLLAFFECCL